MIGANTTTSSEPRSCWMRKVCVEKCQNFSLTKHKRWILLAASYAVIYGSMHSKMVPNHLLRTLICVEFCKVVHSVINDRCWKPIFPQFWSTKPSYCCENIVWL